MIKVLELRPNPKSKSNGIDKYCNALNKLFLDDNDIMIYPIADYPMNKGRILKESYKKGVLVKLLSCDDIDIIHINGFASFSVIQGFRYAKKAKKKIVYTPHWHPFEFLNHPFRAKVFFYMLLKPLVAKYADVVVTLNDEDTRFFKKIHNNVVRIPHWIEDKISDHQPIEKVSNMVLFVGRVNDSNKGAEHLYHLSEGQYEIHCVGPCNRTLRSDMISHVNIPWEELNDLYAKASLLVVPSRYEAFSYVALEALSHGTPVLLSDRVRIADYLGGVTGVFVFEYQNYGDFCNKVKEALSMREKVNTNKVFEIFSEEKVKEKYRNIFCQ